VRPRRGNANGGFVGYGWYGRRNGVNAFRQWGNKGLVNYWWGNDIAKYGVTLQNNRWHHVAATFDGRHRRLWYDFRLIKVAYSRWMHVNTKRNFCVGKTYGREYYKGHMAHLAIFIGARPGSLMKARGKERPVVWIRGTRVFNRNRCFAGGRRKPLPMRRTPYTLEAWIKPWRRGAWTGGIVGWGQYGRRSAVNAFRISGRDSLRNYYWGNVLHATAHQIRRRGRRLHDGNYHHVAATFDGWYQRIWVDFRVVRARRTNGPYALVYKRNFCVGKTYGREWFRGRMREFKIYRWARSPRQMMRRGC